MGLSARRAVHEGFSRWPLASPLARWHVVYFDSHEGKSDLEKSIPRKLKAWHDPAAKFVVVRDQDSADCLDVKARLQALCSESGRPGAMVRIACRELEAWYLADLAAIDETYRTRLARLQAKKKFRQPDQISSPSRELASLVPAFRKIDGARRLGPLLDLENRRSTSFGHSVRGVRRLAGSEA